MSSSLRRGGRACGLGTGLWPCAGRRSRTLQTIKRETETAHVCSVLTGFVLVHLVTTAGLWGCGTPF
jgi:hypothetical protein